MTRTLILLLMLSVPFGPVGSLSAETTEETIDIEGLLADLLEVREVRGERLLPLQDFLAAASAPNTVLLDTRSARAFAEQHLEGAVNLPFPDITQESLARVLGDVGTRVLIYCNNNFSDNEEPFISKQPEAALNLPTFVSLWTYGYQNIYELEDLVALEDERLSFGGERAAP